MIGRLLATGLTGLLLVGCGGKGTLPTNMTMACTIKHTSLLGDVGLSITRTPHFKINVYIASISQPITISHPFGQTTVQGIYEIYEDVYMLEEQDAQSGGWVQRALCICVPGLRQQQPCRGAARTWTSL